MSTLNLTLLTDLYEMTMMQGYFKTGNRDVAVFDAFYRNNPCDGGYAVCAGLDQMIDYIKNLHFDKEDISYLRSLSIFDEDFLTYLSNFKFSGDIYAIPEGTLIFPREPCKSGCSDYGSPVNRNCSLKYHQPPEPDCHQGCPRMLRCPG